MVQDQRSVVQIHSPRPLPPVYSPERSLTVRSEDIVYILGPKGLFSGVRKEMFFNIWRKSSQLRDVRSIRGQDLPTCSSCAHLGTCTRCPGLAFMEGNMRGPSSADCEKSFGRTGVVTAGMRASSTGSHSRNTPGLVQIACIQSSALPAV